MDEVQWNAEKLRQAGIDPSLQNYMLMIQGKGCNQCPLNNRCISALQKTRIFNDYVLRCPVIIVDKVAIEGLKSLL